MIFWHIPLVFDIASYDDLVHLFQHISFIIVGMCIYKIIKSFDFSFLLFFFILSGGFMGIMGLILILTNYPIYSSYTIQSHIDGGNYMIISGIIMMLVILPSVLIKKALELI
jgi:cytochrome c oxidase assembly factor CtaG